MTASAPRPAGSLLSAVALVSAGAIAYEILLMRLLAIVQWHHFAWMVISLALLGYGASGTAIALARDRLAPRFEAVFALAALGFSVAMPVCFLLAQQVPFNALEIVWDPQQFLYLAALYLLFMVPFFLAATCIGLAFTCRDWLIDRIYFFDLLGAGLGAVLIIGVLFLVFPQRALLILALLPLVASVIVGFKTAPRRWLLAGQGLWLLSLVALLLTEPLTLRMSPYKGLSRALEVAGSSITREYSSPLGLVSVLESPSIPIRHAPGLSLASPHTPPQQLAVYTDGDAMSALTAFSGAWDALGYLGDMTSALPYDLLERPRVLVLGAGAGSDVLMALYHNAESVDAVEMDPRVVNVVREDFAAFAGGLYDRHNVRIHLAEARSFAARHRQSYDLVQIGLLDSAGVSGSGVQALNESYLYTIEAMGDYLDLLAPGGLMAITRWMKVPPRDSLKLAATVIAALRARGVDEPGERLAVIRTWNTVTMLVKNGAWTAAERDTIERFTQSRSFDIAWLPGMKQEAANRFNRLDRPRVFEGIQALLGDNAEDFIARYKFRLEPATDDRPYFFHFFKWRVLPEVMSLRERGGASLIEWGYLVLTGTLVQAFVLGALLILAPLGWALRQRQPPGALRLGLYFLLLGLGFLFVEIAFIQKFILFLGRPLYAVAVVLSGFLVFAGIGSALSRRLAQYCRRLGYSPIVAAVCGIVVISAIYLVALSGLLSLLAGLPVLARAAVALALIAPLALCMGFPFPLGLDHTARSAPRFVPWAWGINGFASVISAALATLLAMAFGFDAVVVLALACYVLAAVLLRRTHSG